MASFKIENVSKIYPSGTLALYEVNLTAEDREFIVVTGGEASGKTTLLRLIAGLDDITSGEIKIGDRVVNDVEPKDRDIAMIFRANTLYPSLNVFDNMAYGLKMRKAAPALIEQRVKAASAVLGLDGVLYRKPKALTSVQKQLAVLGRAIVREPRLYLFDDPLSGLTDSLRAEVLSVIVNLQARMQGTFVYATKNVSEAMTFATRMVVLKDGYVQQIDTPANLYDYPANAYVAFFVGSPHISFIREAYLIQRENGVFAAFKGGEIQLEEKLVKRIDKAYIGTDLPVTLGLRAEDLRLSEEGLEAIVAGVSELGGKTFADCDLPCGATLAVPAENVQKGDAVRVAADGGRVYLFDARTQLTVLSRDEGYQNTGRQDADFLPLTAEEVKAVAKKFAPEPKKKGKK